MIWTTDIGGLVEKSIHSFILKIVLIGILNEKHFLPFFSLCVVYSEVLRTVQVAQYSSPLEDS